MSNRGNDESAAVLIMFFVVGVPAILLLMFSRAIGADFLTTCGAVGRSVLVLALAGAVAYFLRPPVLLLLLAIILFIWPCWWAVLDSIASGGIDPADSTAGFLRIERFLPWWDSPTFKWCVELAVGGALGYFGFRKYKDQYSY